MPIKTTNPGYIEAALYESDPVSETAPDPFHNEFDCGIRSRVLSELAGLGVSGADKQVQFNDGGSFAGSASFIFDKVILALGIGTSLPATLDGTMHVHSGSAGAIGATSAADDLIVENDSDGGISILVPNVNIAAINLGTPGRQVGAALRWDFTTNIFRLITGVANATIAIDAGLNQEIMRLTPTNVGIGTSGPAASAKLEISSIVSGLLPPRMTTAQRNAINAPVAGLLIFNLDINRTEIYNGTLWESAGGFVRTTVSTTDASATTLATIPIPEGSAVLIVSTVTAHRTNGLDRAGYIRRAVAFRIGAANAQFEGAVDPTFSRDSNNGWDEDLVLSGSNVVVEVNGAVGHDVNWVNRYTTEAIS